MVNYLKNATIACAFMLTKCLRAADLASFEHSSRWLA